MDLGRHVVPTAPRGDGAPDETPPGGLDEMDDSQDAELLVELQRWSAMRGAPDYLALFQDSSESDEFSGTATVSGSGKPSNPRGAE
eukprot:3996224-Pyramimonas_sp.AAC.1